MRPVEALKVRIREESTGRKDKKKPSLLDVLRERNSSLEVLEKRGELLRRIGKR